MSVGLPTAGDVFAGKYRVERVLGKGGMGVVFAAEHLHLRERVALKLMLPEVAHDPVALARFVREGRSMARIKSEHVVRVLDVGTNDAGLPFLVMEYLDGADLAEVLAKRGPIDVRTAVDYLLQAILALSEAHALGIVHRDLKPHNLFLTTRRDGTPCVKVLDFGIATSEAGGSRGLTATGLLVGSPQYMAPEQLFGKEARVDARADIWALGCVLYELLTAKVPFEAVSLPDLLIKVQLTAPTPLAARVATVPAGVDAIVTKCLEKDPGRRFADVSLLAGALAAFGSEAAASTAVRVARVLQSQPHVVLAGARDVEAGMATMAMQPMPITAPALSVTRDDPRLATSSPRGAIPLAAILGALAAALVLGGGGVFFLMRGSTQPAHPDTRIAASPATLDADIDADAPVDAATDLDATPLALVPLLLPSASAPPPARPMPPPVTPMPAVDPPPADFRRR